VILCSTGALKSVAITGDDSNIETVHPAAPIATAVQPAKSAFLIFRKPP
jgi:hypothetical protein